MQIHGNTVLEISWTIIPALILAVMAVFTVAGRSSTSPRSPTGDDVDQHRRHRPPVVLGVRVHRRTSFFTANEMHIPVGTADRAERSPRRPKASSTPSGSRSSPARRTSCPVATHFLTVRGRRARHLPRSVRGVLRPVARRHAHAGDRETEDDYDDVGRPAEGAARRRAAGVRRREPQRGRERRLGLHDAVTRSSRCRTIRDRARTSRTSVTARPSPAASTTRTLENLWKWVHDAPSRKPMGDLDDSAEDAQLLRRGDDRGTGAGDRRVPVQHGDRPGQRERA